MNKEIEIKATNNSKVKLFVPILILLILVRVILLFLKIKYSIFFYIKGIDIFHLNYLMNIVLVLCLTVLITLKVKERIYKIGILVFILSGIIIISTIVLSLTSNTEYFYFESPNKENKLIVNESSQAFWGRAKFYTSINTFLVRDTNHSIRLDDGMSLFRGDKYSIAWINENKILLTYELSKEHIKQTVIELK